MLIDVSNILKSHVQVLAQPPEETLSPSPSKRVGVQERINFSRKQEAVNTGQGRWCVTAVCILDAGII